MEDKARRRRRRVRAGSALQMHIRGKGLFGMLTRLRRESMAPSPLTRESFSGTTLERMRPAIMSPQSRRRLRRSARKTGSGKRCP